MMQDLASAQQASNSLQGSAGAQTQALQQKQAEVGFSACIVTTPPSSVYICSVLQIQSVRETNRLLDGRMQQLQSQLQESAANNKQARVCCHNTQKHM